MNGSRLVTVDIYLLIVNTSNDLEKNSNGSSVRQIPRGIPLKSFRRYPGLPTPSRTFPIPTPAKRQKATPKGGPERK